MSKKRKKRVIIRKQPSPKKVFNKEALLSEMEIQTRKIFHGMILPLEQRMDALFAKIENVKSNVITSNTLLERKKIFTREQFLKEFEAYESEEVARTDGEGRMEGHPVFSIYNEGER